MSSSWPAELRARLYEAAAKNEETVSNPVRISITYPREEIMITDVNGTCRQVSVPPCRIVLTTDHLTPMPVTDDPQYQPSTSETPQTHVTFQPTTATSSPNDMVMTDGFPGIQCASVKLDVWNTSQYPACSECVNTNCVCENSAGFPCKGCDSRNIPCVVTFYPRAHAGAHNETGNPAYMDDFHSQQTHGEAVAQLNFEYLDNKDYSAGLYDPAEAYASQDILHGFGAF